jgi:hypothetical protein
VRVNGHDLFGLWTRDLRRWLSRSRRCSPNASPAASSTPVIASRQGRGRPAGSSAARSQGSSAQCCRDLTTAQRRQLVLADDQVNASGDRADLSTYLPVF